MATRLRYSPDLCNECGHHHDVNDQGRCDNGAGNCNCPERWDGSEWVCAHVGQCHECGSRVSHDRSYGRPYAVRQADLGAGPRPVRVCECCLQGQRVPTCEA